MSSDHTTTRERHELLAKKLPFPIIPTAIEGVYTSPPWPKDFDLATATDSELKRHGIFFRRPGPNDDPRLHEASLELGGGKWGTLLNVTIPLSLHGVIAGLLLVFAASCSALVTQSIIGGGRLIFMPLYIYQQGMQAQNWPFAAAISLVLLIAVLAVAATLNAFGRLATRRLHV